MFGQFQNNFQPNQIVRIGQTTSHLDGEEAQIIGVAVRNVVDAYIVLLREPEAGFSSIMITEVCLTPVKDDQGNNVFGEPVSLNR